MARELLSSAMVRQASTAVALCGRSMIVGDFSPGSQPSSMYPTPGYVRRTDRVVATVRNTTDCPRLKLVTPRVA
jgi:hypothetical protein